MRCTLAVNVLRHYILITYRAGALFLINIRDTALSVAINKKMYKLLSSSYAQLKVLLFYRYAPQFYRQRHSFSSIVENI